MNALLSLIEALLVLAGIGVGAWSVTFTAIMGTQLAVLALCLLVLAVLIEVVRVRRTLTR